MSIYMISGIPNRSICRLIFYENALIGIFAFVIGLPVGILFSQLLEAVLSSMFGVMYVLRWNFSFNATALTCIYFLAMLFYAIRRNNKWISKVTLYDLLYYERQNEKKLLHDGVSAIALFFISVLTGCVGNFLMCNVDYLSGKWVDKESLTQLYAMAICLFYLSLVFEITGAAILATQILSDREKKRRQDCILQQLGMNRRDIEKLNNRQLSMMFLLPLLPALIISSCFVYVSAGKMQLSAFHLPVFSNNLWIIGSLSIAFVFFILLYGVYYIAARISYRRQ